MSDVSLFKELSKLLWCELYAVIWYEFLWKFVYWEDLNLKSISARIWLPSVSGPFRSIATNSKLCVGFVVGWSDWYACFGGVISWHAWQWVTTCSTSAFKPGHQTLVLRSSFVLDIPKCWLCAILRILAVSDSGITIRLSLSRMLLCTLNWFRILWYGFGLFDQFLFWMFLKTVCRVSSALVCSVIYSRDGVRNVIVDYVAYEMFSNFSVISHYRWISL